ncbi:Uncharacterised protein [Salmonella enterica subsp. arizonae]|nr:Uncharacterised protein [Salmonella enterica subsp. arizonae]
MSGSPLGQREIKRFRGSDFSTNSIVSAGILTELSHNGSPYKTMLNQNLGLSITQRKRRRGVGRTRRYCL